jgi:cytochrome c oxidase subunit 2
MNRKTGALGAFGVLLLAALPALAEPHRWQLNMTRGVSETSRAVYELHMLIFLVCVAIGVVVFGAMAYAMLKFRKSKGAVAATWSHNTKAEMVWTVVPILILIVMAFPATKVLVNMASSGDAGLTVKVTGYQWKWRYELVEYEKQPLNVNFMSMLSFDDNKARQLKSGIDPASVPNYLLNVDNPLVLPVDTKVRFLFTADDVIHAWWVPDLGWKQDAIPGFINDAWTKVSEPGTYRGQCAELCGKDHGFMPIVVKFVPKDEFKTWVAQHAKAAPAAPAAPAEAAPAAPVEPAPAPAAAVSAAADPVAAPAKS